MVNASAIHRVKIYPVDKAIGFPNTYPLDDDVSGGSGYPTFEQPGSGCYSRVQPALQSLSEAWPCFVHKYLFLYRFGRTRQRVNKTVINLARLL